MDDSLLTIAQMGLAALAGVAGFTWKASEIRRNIERELGSKIDEQYQMVITLREQIKYQQALIDKNNAIVENALNETRSRLRDVELFLSKQTGFHQRGK